MPEPRYAVYFAPPAQDPLWSLAARWLGRDAAADAPCARLGVAGVPAERQAAMTETPARYGFHATLKPPFRLAPGQAEAELVAALDAFAAGNRAFEAPPLVLAAIGGFLALVPAGPSAELDLLAAGCVEALDGFRAPPDEAEAARRGAAGLSPRQAALLARWGYPYVMEEFRFHMTLTDRLDPAERKTVADALRSLIAPLLGRPLRVDAVCLFVQPAPDAPFRLERRCRFGG